MKSKESLKIVIYYMLFSFLWILFSDKLLFILTQDLSLLQILGNSKGIFFIIFTSFFLFKTIKQSYSKIENLNKELKKTIIESQNNQNLYMKKNLELDKVNNIIDDYMNIFLKMLSSIEYNDELFISEIFRIAFKVAKESDLGSAYIIEDDKVKFIDSIGFSLDDLKEMPKDIDQYKFSKDGIVSNINNESIVLKDITNVNSPLTQVKESLYIGIF